MKGCLSNVYVSYLQRRLATGADALLAAPLGDGATEQEIDWTLVDYVIEKLGKKAGKSWSEQVQGMTLRQWEELAQGCVYWTGNFYQPLLLRDCMVSFLHDIMDNVLILGTDPTI